MSGFQTVSKKSLKSSNNSNLSLISAAKYPEQFKTLIEMGFEKDKITEALNNTIGNLEAATAILLGEPVSNGTATTSNNSQPVAPMKVVGKQTSKEMKGANSLTNPKDIKEQHNKFMATYKILKCKDRNPHDKRMCIYWHSKGDRRRNPFEISYTCSECPNSSETVVCPEGDNCMKAHNMLERMFHPDLFKISMCQRGPNGQQCERGNLCAFAHSEEDHRQPPASFTKHVVTTVNPTFTVLSPVEKLTDSPLLDNIQEKLIRLIKSHGPEGIISSELPKKFVDSFSERLELFDESGEKFRIKDLLLSHPNISVIMYKGVQPKYVYDENKSSKAISPIDSTSTAALVGTVSSAVVKAKSSSSASDWNMVSSSLNTAAGAPVSISKTNTTHSSYSAAILNSLKPQTAVAVTSTESESVLNFSNSLLSESTAQMMSSKLLSAITAPSSFGDEQNPTSNGFSSFGSTSSNPGNSNVLDILSSQRQIGFGPLDYSMSAIGKSLSNPNEAGSPAPIGSPPPGILIAPHNPRNIGPSPLSPSRVDANLNYLSNSHPLSTSSLLVESSSKTPESIIQLQNELHLKQLENENLNIQMKNLLMKVSEYESKVLENAKFKSDFDNIKTKLSEKETELSAKVDDSIRKDQAVVYAKQERYKDINQFYLSIGQIENALIVAAQKECVNRDEMSFQETIEESARQREELTKFVGGLKNSLNKKIMMLNEQNKSTQGFGLATAAPQQTDNYHSTGSSRGGYGSGGYGNVGYTSSPTSSVENLMNGGAYGQDYGSINYSNNTNKYMHMNGFGVEHSDHSAHYSLDMMSNRNPSSSSSVRHGTTEDRTKCGLPGCLNEGLFVCSACGLIGYCGPEHQREHWPSHMDDCGLKS